MIDFSRRTVLATGAAAAAASVVPQVFAQAQPAAGPMTGLPEGAKVGFYEKGNVRIRYADMGTGFPLLAIPGGGLNSRMEVWARAVINIPAEFRGDFRISPWTSATPPAASPPARCRLTIPGVHSPTISSG